ncbi:non-receptor serine/threonine protein kinase [Lithospermum erythrorhizon]|uniref:non-specific serine/threonine protein kinase n=1 Tax=Lithospermum erythrorhizon TaxID=34254 RepID=A0AAV3NM59_LITER
MGRGTKKKKKRGGGSGGSGGGRKDHNLLDSDSSEIVSEEITALCAIFQDDCKVISDSPPQIEMKLRPYSKDTGYEESEISAALSVRFFPGYPYKCPKLQITPGSGLSIDHANNLIALLTDQANSNAREGRVMIYNLVEAAQEFLSEIVPQALLHESVLKQLTATGVDLSKKGLVDSHSKICSSGGPFIYGLLDLFSGSGESWNWLLGVEDSDKINGAVLPDTSPNKGHNTTEKKGEHNKDSVAIVDSKPDSLRKSPTKLDTLEEVAEDENTDLSRELSDESVRNFARGTRKDIFVMEETETDDDSGDLESARSTSESESSESGTDRQLCHTLKRDLIMAHLLRLACSPKGPLAEGLQEIASELCNLGIVDKRVKDLAAKPSSSFDKTLGDVFGHHMMSSKVSQFWKTASDFSQSSAVPSSRYLNDFEELQTLGHGGFGLVVLCKNKLDGRQYAVKMILLKDKRPPVNDRILREVATLSRLQHQHVVRYYQAWFETGVVGGFADNSPSSRTAASSNFSYLDASSSDGGQENKVESTYLYIQMEYCPRTLRQMFESYGHFDKDLAWHLSRQIVEGLAHIHGQGIIHRDLTPNNVFFDARNDIKIGDFGLAKFLKLEQLDQDVEAAETVGISIDGTGQVGTYFYTAPEIEQGWPKINEKADMYSFGVVFFELWHPFETAMERHILLSNLKQKGEVPPTWVTEFPEQAALLRQLMSQSPSERPSATELLQHAFPPKMESELLDSMLRTIHNSEDTSIYDKIVKALFDAEMLRKKDHQESIERLKLDGNDTSSFIISDVETDKRDQIVEVATEMFRQHCAKHLEVIPMLISGDFPDLYSFQATPTFLKLSILFSHVPRRNNVKLMTHGGDLIELSNELRLPFARWVIATQKSSFKRYEISYVYRRSIGHSPPNRYLQGDFDIIGGATALTEAEVIKASVDILCRIFHYGSCDIHLNHADLLEAIWCWAGVKSEHRYKVAELLSLLGSLRPQSPERKSKWVVIRRQLRQELNLVEAVVNRLQTVGLRFCGVADQILPRLRGALPADKSTRKALDELSELLNFLRVWKIENDIFIDSLMPPTEIYHRNLYFQIYRRKESTPGAITEGTLLAVGGRYDYLLHHMGDSEYCIKVEMKVFQELVILYVRLALA